MLLFSHATPSSLISSYLLRAPYSHMGQAVGSSLTSPSACIRLHILITGTLLSSLPSHPLHTPSGPHHMLLKLPSWDIGCAPLLVRQPLRHPWDYSCPSCIPHLPTHQSRPAAPVPASPSGPTAASSFLFSCSFQPGGRPLPLPASPWPLPLPFQLKCCGPQFYTEAEVPLLRKTSLERQHGIGSEYGLWSQINLLPPGSVTPGRSPRPVPTPQ